MSYIRPLSNPEGLYILCDGHGIHVICQEQLGPEGFYMPVDVFHGILERWVEDDCCEEEIEFQGARLCHLGICLGNESGNWKWELSFQGNSVRMYEVTLFYIAHNYAESKKTCTDASLEDQTS